MIFVVRLNGLTFTDFASKTRQAACRKAFRYWIINKDIKCQPQTDCDGWWKGTTCKVLKPVK